jgi:hypothetical protein
MLRNPDEFYHKMKKMKKDDRSGEALFMQSSDPKEKANQMK